MIRVFVGHHAKIGKRGSRPFVVSVNGKQVDEVDEVYFDGPVTLMHSEEPIMVEDGDEEWEVHSWLETKGPVRLA